MEKGFRGHSTQGPRSVGLHLLQGKPDLKAGTPGLRLNGYVTAVHANDPADHVQPQPQPATRSLSSKERLEDARLQLEWNTRTIVLDSDSPIQFPPTGADVNFDRVLGSVLYRVADQVLELGLVFPASQASLRVAVWVRVETWASHPARVSARAQVSVSHLVEASVRLEEASRLAAVWRLAAASRPVRAAPVCRPAPRRKLNPRYP